MTSGCRIELVGRTPLPAEPEDTATAAATDKAGLRTALIGLGHRSPAEIERMASRILAVREVRATARRTARIRRYRRLSLGGRP